jgi:protein arginine N-methyltransferase 1
MYSLSGFGDMILDSVRMQAYVRALRNAVKPGSVVLDIGTGTGIFAVLAHQFGARRVIAVEPNDSIQIAREIAAANGCGDAIEFHQVLSTQLELDELADVVISDLRGVLPLFGQHIPSIVDARRRLLKPGGAQIPERDDLWLSVLEDPETYQAIISPWGDSPYGIGMEPARKRMVNRYRRVTANAAQLLAEPMPIGVLDYRSIENPDFIGVARLTTTRGGLAHGLCAWFDATLSEGVGFSNAPSVAGAPRAIYRNLFLPFPSPVELQAGDALDVKLKADLVGEEYVWRWETTVLEQGDATRTKAKYRQSDLAGESLSLASLRKRAANYVPRLNEDGAIDEEILQLMRDGLPLAEISRRIATNHPGRFGDWQQALSRVGELSLRYSR